MSERQHDVVTKLTSASAAPCGGVSALGNVVLFNIQVRVNHRFTVALSHPRYRPDVDGLRAVAILLVVGFHAFPEWLPGGFIGVDIFFVISGFLITSIIVEALQRKQFSFAEFYARRGRRIFPALLVVLAFCFVAGWYLLLKIGRAHV